MLSVRQGRAGRAVHRLWAPSSVFCPFCSFAKGACPSWGGHLGVHHSPPAPLPHSPSPGLDVRSGYRLPSSSLLNPHPISFHTGRPQRSYFPGPAAILPQVTASHRAGLAPTARPPCCSPWVPSEAQGQTHAANPPAPDPWDATVRPILSQWTPRGMPPVWTPTRGTLFPCQQVEAEEGLAFPAVSWLPPLGVRWWALHPRPPLP